jgi:hypothetical protein
VNILLFLYDVKARKHSNRDIFQKAWEDISKEMGREDISPHLATNPGTNVRKRRIYAFFHLWDEPNKGAYFFVAITI